MWWRDFAPSAIPSIELIDISHFFRLGEKLNSDIIQNADKLGAWWKFLAMATLFYSIALRSVFLIFIKYLIKKELKRELMNIDGVKTLIHDFQTPYVSTQSTNIEKHLIIDGDKKESIVKDTKEKYSAILGWNFTIDEINLINDNKNIEGSLIYQLGGGNSFSKDQKIIENLNGIILLYVKSWEPPTMDFLDTLELLVENMEIIKIEILPLGLVRVL